MTATTRDPLSAPITCVHVAPLRDESRRRLTVVLGLTSAVMIAEVVGGFLANSLALLADAGHMLADVAAIGIALLVSHLARRPATAERSFGLMRLEILGALANGALLIAIAVGIAIEAWHRFRAPEPVHAPLLLGVAGVGLAANVIGAAVLHRGHQHSLNQRGAYLHVLSDLLGSVGALAAGVVLLITGWTAADVIVSVLISILVLRGAWRLVRESADILLEATPAHISLTDVHDRLASLEGVASVHDLHVWTVTSGVVALSGHLVVRNPADNQRILEQAQARLRELGIGHVTVQMEKDATCL
jgi:cobalt-zinc-cadmium efflux system protein